MGGLLHSRTWWSNYLIGFSNGLNSSSTYCVINALTLCTPSVGRLVSRAMLVLSMKEIT